MNLKTKLFIVLASVVLATATIYLIPNHEGETIITIKR